MNKLTIQDSIARLENYLVKTDYRGYDPYDTLNSWFPFKIFGKWGPVLSTQFQKRNPLNIRPIIGIKKDHNPKAMGLFLQAYSILYGKTNNEEYLKKAKYFYNWLITNYSKGYSGICWGYNFPWASPNKYMEAYTPSAVVTGFVIRGVFEFSKISNDNTINETIKSASAFIINDLEWTNTESDICISYTPLKRDICYNASLLGAEVLAINHRLNNDDDSQQYSQKAVEFVLSRQKENGMWAYSEEINSDTERFQSDFHQGYILESIFNIANLLDIKNSKWDNAIRSGLLYYRKKQFHDNGRSLWRVPKEYPVEIHNQAQGIITFTRLADYIQDDSKFSNIISDWTINNMQCDEGYFYYQKHKYYTIKIPYIRWSQAWMFLALAQMKK